MNFNPNQPDLPQDAGPIDDALLDDALAEPTPAELEAKILDLTDPQMLSLLDEAMAPEAVPTGLNERILAATAAAQSPVELHVEASVESPAVLARISPATFRYAAAAAIALAVGLGVWFTNQESIDSESLIAGVINMPSVSSEETSEDDPDWLTGEYAANTDFFESDLDDIADGLNDATISRDTIWSELDAYEQFLTEIASDDV